jgi:hypothetical protein
MHDAGGALGAEDALVDRVVGVALDIADLAIAQGNADTTATGTHVTRRILDLDTTVVVIGL